jgi:RNA polymerase sigma factor (sigma-70 family)
MSFPDTRLTLIQRLAAGGSTEDWHTFLKDYWGPVCRFSLRFGAANLDDAEDVASQTFEALWENRLLVRWVSNRSAKLRSLLCGVARNILSNQKRVQEGRERLAHEIAQWLDQSERALQEQTDAFYAAWVEDVVQRAVQSLALEYYAQGKGDYLRVFYGRLCQRLTIAQVAEALKIKPATVDNYFRHGKDRLRQKLEEVVRRQVCRYCPAEEADQEFELEWRQLGRYVADFGGLEEAVRRAYDLLDPVTAKRDRLAGLSGGLSRLTSIICSSGGENLADQGA